ncbi:sugar-binding transcriptional regulator [Phytoactinopolyspora halotolerans]|uniref:Cro/Cl family transcriptional regulator n=1 Tax=Phytoactinopolyspora halotolerans TaxID=1981512 RepID=A0A6L9SGK8_9ACTN|nr:sugar-binding domain-containing protein [Phytoactinopolyspora halotolerans]NEE04279.1 Cro/Cl family transcriptional regulator [Phytoactinopolyspora halotolerans]
MAQRGRPPKQGRPHGPSELVLAGAVARRHYVDGRSKIEIADEFGLSRFQVARIISDARAQGWVRVEIVLPGHIDDAASLAVHEALGVRRAIVVDAPEGADTAVREEVGAAVAGVLTEQVQTGQVIGLTWSRTIAAMVEKLERLVPCTVVQLAGSLAVRGSSSGTVEVVRSVAAVSGGEAFPIYAPLVVEDAATAAALRRQPEIARALARADQLDLAVVSIGAWAEGLSTVWDAVTDDERTAGTAQGAVGECSGRLFDADGRDVAGGFDDRVVGVTLDQLRAAPEVIATGYGAQRASAVRAAVRAGFVGTLVVDTALARALLA